MIAHRRVTYRLARQRACPWRRLPLEAFAPGKPRRQKSSSDDGFLSSPPVVEALRLMS